MKTKPKETKLPPHVRTSTKEILDGLHEICKDDRALLLLLLDEEDDRRVDKILAGQHGDHVLWSIGYLRGVTESLKIKIRDLLPAPAVAR